jgi:hypothetical protein
VGWRDRRGFRALERGEDEAYWILIGGMRLGFMMCMIIGMDEKHSQITAVFYRAQTADPLFLVIFVKYGSMPACQVKHIWLTHVETALELVV